MKEIELFDKKARSIICGSFRRGRKAENVHNYLIVKLTN